MNRSKIEWTDFSWNPIKGLCPVNCKTPDGKEYCYARRMYKRFGWNPEIHYELDDLKILHELPGKEYSKIFVCSTFELFHPITNALLFPLTEGSDITYRDMIFKIIEEHPQHIFQILTKFPQNIDREMPDNVHLGVSITGDNEVYDRYQGLLDAKARIKFISFEPLFKAVYLPTRINWAIIGRLTGYGHKYDPPLSLLKIMVNTFKVNNIPIFLKQNLKGIYEPLIQEFPG